MSLSKGPRKRMTLRLPPSLGAYIDTMAAKAKMPLNEFICRELEKQIARDEVIRPEDWGDSSQ